MKSAIKPVIMAGGFGTRLWPLSNISCPKQFIRILGGLSTFQHTLLRHKSLGKPIVIVNEKHIDISARQVTEVDLDVQFIVEPENKNTAACSILASLLAKQDGCDRVLLLPSDLCITDDESYLKTLQRGFEYLGQSVVTIGIKPTFAHTGYGYIKAGAMLASDTYKVEQFVEKPDITKASDYLEHGGYFWNSGIFMYDATYLLEQARCINEALCNDVSQALDLARRESFGIKLPKKSYSTIEPISVDYALMEHISDMKLIVGHFGWSDIGSWDSLWQLKPKDRLSNYTEGNVLTRNVTNSYMVSGKKPLVVVGLDNVTVIDTDDAVFVMNKACSEEIKTVAQGLYQLLSKQSG